MSEWKFYNWIVCSLASNRLPLTLRIRSSRANAANQPPRWFNNVQVNEGKGWETRRKGVCIRDENGEMARRRTRGWVVRGNRLFKFARGTSIAGPILEIQWVQGISMNDRRGNRWNVIKERKRSMGWGDDWLMGGWLNEVRVKLFSFLLQRLFCCLSRFLFRNLVRGCSVGGITGLFQGASYFCSLRAKLSII